MQILKAEEIKAWLDSHPNWQQEGGEITTSYVFKNFVDAFGFMSKLAIEMEKANHHATLVNTYNRVKISMNTHEAGDKITHRDTQLAETIEALKGDL